MYEVTYLLKKLLFFMLSFYLHYTEIMVREREREGGIIKLKYYLY